MDNRTKEIKLKDKYYEAWNISKKYSKVLIDHEDKDEFLILASNVYKQYLSELKHKNISLKKNYVEVWGTMLNTINNNMDIYVCRMAIKLLYQTSIQRSIE